MKGVVLTFGEDSQLSMCTEFLRLAHPLEHTAAVKKSQVGVMWRRT